MRNTKIGDWRADGEKGTKGDRGKDAVFDEDRLIERILNEPRLKKKFDDADQTKQKKQSTTN